MKQKFSQIPTVLQGQAGVFRVLSELVLRGHRPYTPSADTGVDILLDSGVRIQVKSTMRASAHWRLAEGTFSFSLAQAKRIIKSGVRALPARQFSEKCDFVVLWAIEPERFWVVPAAVLDGRHTVTIGVKARWADFDLTQIETLKVEGKTLAEISAILGVSVKTITRRTHQPKPTQAYTNLHQYENRWDLITGVIATLREANAVVSSAAIDRVAVPVVESK